MHDEDKLGSLKLWDVIEERPTGHVLNFTYYPEIENAE